MTFADTYREERLISRRSRARKARIAGRVIGFGLTACLVVALRTDPQLRSMVEDAALAVIGASQAEGSDANGVASSAQAAGIKALAVAPNSEHDQALETLGIADVNALEADPSQTGSAPQGKPIVARMPQSRVKVNRPNSG